MTPVIRHYLHVYQRPKQGTSFLRRYLAYNYQHTITNRGGFDTASCDIAVQSDTEGQQILEQYLGCFVAIYVDNPAVPVWEGLVNRITFNSGGASYTISLDEMANRVSTVYTGVTNVAAETTAANNTASQAVYGIKQDQIELGVDTSAATQKNLLRDTALAQRAFPQSSYGQAQGNTDIVHLELIGIYHTLEWVKFFTGLTTATSAFSANIIAVLAANPNGATFFNNTDTANISTNVATAPNQERGSSFWDRILRITEAGDGTNYWVCGVTPTDRNTGRRAFYYQLANTAIEYSALKSDGLKPRNLYGKPIRPWAVVPDRGIRVNDALVGSGGTIQTDPTQVYIQRIQYDANSQQVQWFGADDTTARAAFLLSRGFKPIAADFGAPLRTIAT
jgi:hypothetical protein